MNDPFTLPAGSTVQDRAGAIHRELAEKLKSARIWGTGVYDGRNVQLSHVLNDKNVVELHFGWTPDAGATEVRQVISARISWFGNAGVDNWRGIDYLSRVCV